MREDVAWPQPLCVGERQIVLPKRADDEHPCHDKFIACLNDHDGERGERPVAQQAQDERERWLGSDRCLVCGGRRKHCHTVGKDKKEHEGYEVSGDMGKRDGNVGKDLGRRPFPQVAGKGAQGDADGPCHDRRDSE